MRRRPKEHPAGVPPPLVLTYTGRSTREALAWLRVREEWWTENRDSEDPGWLDWITEGHDQVGDLPWCGDLISCGDPDCLCVTYPEHLTIEGRTRETSP